MNVLSYHYFGDEIVKIDEAREYDHVFRPRFDSDLLHIPFNKLNLTFNPNGDGDIFHFQYKTLGSSYELEILKKLPKEILDKFKKGECKFIFDGGSESRHDTSILYNIQQYCDDVKLNSENILILSGTLNIEDLNFTKIKVCNFLETLTFTWGDYKDIFDKSFDWLFKNSLFYLRQKYYLNTNFAPRKHRVDTIKYLNDFDLLDKGLVSFPDVYREVNNKVMYDKLDNDLKEKCDTFKNLLPLNIDTAPSSINSDYEYNPEPVGDEFYDSIGQGVVTKTFNEKSVYTQWDSMRDMKMVNPINYFSTYFTLEAETIFDDRKSVILTEKVWRPILMYSPFLILSNRHTLKSLKDLGFKTFDKWWDESYDNELDPDKRHQMVMTQVLKLCKMDKLDLHKMYNDMKNVLQYNKRYFMEEFIYKIQQNVYKKIEDLI
jgi:hypothetical protein|tara:strand:+ start:138 stop:1433 length:1296 start_codon:yes stop_codon:yes gene_type:complete